jgi:non-homologous end joining protein Ku
LIVKTKAGHFDPSRFEDQYEDALKEVLKKKQEGKLRFSFNLNDGWRKLTYSRAAA